MIPRIRGKVGQAYEPEDVKGKWFFEMWLTTIGGDEGKSLGVFGPFDTEAMAKKELESACRLACESIERRENGTTSGKYVDMKDNKVKDWDKKPKQPKSTMVELVEELRKLPRSKEIDFMIEEALAGEYHDYKNEKYTCGKMESATRLDSLGYPDLANRIKQGEFDEEADEEDKATLRNMLDQNKMGGKGFKKLFGL